MAEVSDITIKRTQDSLGKLIKKPALTDKLLRKPPFKFLHDIIAAVITNTGLFNGLYTNDELQSENIKDREAKIAFLQKAIDTLKIATKQDLRARPSKIVAGLEAEKTNEFLIAIAKAIDRKVDTTDAVAQVKSGNVASPSKKDPKSTATTKTESRTKGKDSKLKGSDTKPSKKSDGNKKAAATKQSSKDSNEAKKSRTRTQSQGKEPKDSDKKSSPKVEEPATKVKPIETPPNAANDIQNTNGHATESKINIQNEQMSAAVEQANESPKENSILPPPPATTTTTQDQKKDVNADQKTERTEKSAKSIDGVDRRSSVSKKAGSAETDNDADEVEIRKTPKSSTNDTTENKNKSQENTGTDNTVPEKPSNDKPRSSKSRRSKRDANENGVTTAAKPEITSSVSVDQPAERSTLVEASTKSLDAANRPSSKSRPALRSAAVRPISARPSAPRRRDRNVRQILHTESFIQEPNSQQNSKANKKNAIPEFDDADNIVITETIQDNISLLDENVANNNNNDITTDIDGKQGHLVQQILETQTAILKADASKTDPSAGSEDSILSDRKSFTRNTTELRKMIQKLSLYITPLGKMMEYFQEDVDAMQIELLMWQKAGAAAQTDIKEEQRTTEKLLENFKYHLAEINNSIKDHMEQINNTTTNIIQNEEKISKLIASL